jgi:dTDP-4-dehydrorhamnose 3,5-epimerase
MKIEALAIPGVFKITPRVHEDARGSFLESWQRDRYAAAGIDIDWVQDNVSRSRRGVLRGLHFQHPHGQAKLVTVLAGEVLDVIVDVRRHSPTFGQHVSVRLSADDPAQVFIPASCAHGFLVLSDEAVFSYKCSARYAPEAEHTLLWNDPDLAIPWPTSVPTLAPKDIAGRRLCDFVPEDLPTG